MRSLGLLKNIVFTKRGIQEDISLAKKSTSGYSLISRMQSSVLFQTEKHGEMNRGLKSLLFFDISHTLPREMGGFGKFSRGRVIFLYWKTPHPAGEETCHQYQKERY